jgi:hypothetical protein
MSTLNPPSMPRPRRPLHPVAVVAALAGSALAAPVVAQDAPATPLGVHFDVVAIDYALEAPEVVRPGWNTFRFTNEGEEPHFVLFARIPDEQSFEGYLTDVLGPFGSLWASLRDGEIGPEALMEGLGTELPEWFWGVEFHGGAGIVPAGGATEITVLLPPGTYAIECYMKTPDGALHNVEGMIRELRVDGPPTGATPPEADILVTISNDTMRVDGDLTPGRRTVAVHVVEDPEGVFGHNLHVARDVDDVDEVVRWMNFIELEGQMPPAPATFLGGVHLLKAGQTGYFTADFEAGRHLFLSEYTAAMGVLRQVEIRP